jgi:hypothetical protein
MILTKKIRKGKNTKKVFFVDENFLKHGKEIIIFNNEDKIIENEYLDDNLHGYCFTKNKAGDILKEERYWHGYFCDDKERFKKLMTNYRIELNEKKYDF